MNKKRVNVKVQNGPGVYSINPPIVRNAMNIELSVGDIQRCIWCKAIVEEILKDGSVIRLNLNNFDKNNDYSEEVIKQLDETQKISNFNNEPEVVIEDEVPNKIPSQFNKKPTPIKTFEDEKPVETTIKDVVETKEEEVKPVVENKEELSTTTLNKSTKNKK